MRTDDRREPADGRRARVPPASRAGQAILLVLLFVIPMVLAFGLVVRTNHAVVMKVRVQNAADAGALAVGAHVSRVMNQVALHNMMIYKYHALVAAVKIAIEGAKEALDEVKKRRQKAKDAKDCWQRSLDRHQGCCTYPEYCGEGTQCYTHIQEAQQCIQCLTTQDTYWDRIEKFWNSEKQWLESRKTDFERSIGGMCKSAGDKSKKLVDELQQSIPDELARMAKAHALKTANGEGLFYSLKSSVLQKADLPIDQIFDTGVDKGKWAQIALDAKENPSTYNDYVAGILHFEGTPPDLGSRAKQSDKGGKTKAFSPSWGATHYFLEYIYNVHFGIPGYFTFTQMHGPLGNPDTDKASCGGDNHPGCDGPPSGSIPTSEDRRECNANGKGCWEDWDTYSRDYAKEKADPKVDQTTEDEFNNMSETVYKLASGRQMEHFVYAKIAANQGFFQSLFPAHTIDTNKDSLPLDSKQTGDAFFYGLSKFELYNLTETNGTHLKRGEYGNYPDTFMTQDWRCLLAPMIPETEITGSGAQSRAGDDLIRGQVAH